jgi:hypothetical protein
MRARRKLPQRRKGLQIVGPGFYLWDRDAREALSLAAELSRRRLQTPVRAARPALREPD